MLVKFHSGLSLVLWIMSSVLINHHVLGVTKQKTCLKQCVDLLTDCDQEAYRNLNAIVYQFRVHDSFIEQKYHN